MTGRGSGNHKGCPYAVHAYPLWAGRDNGMEKTAYAVG